MKGLIPEPRSYACLVRTRRDFAERNESGFPSGRFTTNYSNDAHGTDARPINMHSHVSIFIGIALDLHTGSGSTLLSFTKTPPSLDHTKCSLIAVSKYTALVVIQELGLEFHARSAAIYSAIKNAGSRKKNEKKDNFKELKMLLKSIT